MEHSRLFLKNINSETEPRNEPLNLSKGDTKSSQIETVMIKCEPIDDYEYPNLEKNCEDNNLIRKDSSNSVSVETEPITDEENDIEIKIKQEPKYVTENIITRTDEQPELDVIKIEVEIQPISASIPPTNTYMGTQDAYASCSTFNEQQEIQRQQLLNDLSQIGSQIQHFQKTKRAKKAYPCTQCHMAFSKKDRLTKHEITHLGLKYSCDECHKEFSSKNNMLRHKHIHFGIKAFACDHCGKSFMEKTYLAAHLRTHVEDKFYKCSVCGKEFRERAHLIRHERIHSGERPYTCEVCHKQFKQSAHLSCHRKIHKKKVVLYCDMCKEGFLEKEDLYEHHKVHIGEKAYSCEVCHRQFSQNSHLQDHIRVHNGKRPFACPLCKKKFSQRSTLNRHIKTHSGEKPFPCPVCQKRFKQKTHVTKHVKLHERGNEFIVPTQLDENMKIEITKQLDSDLKNISNQLGDSEIQVNDSELIIPTPLDESKGVESVRNDLGSSDFNIVTEIVKIKDELVSQCIVNNSY